MIAYNPLGTFAWVVSIAATGALAIAAFYQAILSAEDKKPVRIVIYSSSGDTSGVHLPHALRMDKRRT